MWILIYVFKWLYFIRCFTSFSSIDHCVCLYAWFFLMVLSVNPSADVNVSRDLNIHQSE